MNPSYEELALLRAHEPGLQPPTRRVPPRLPRGGPRSGRRHLAGALRRMANRLEN
jgi:hypothetical protein